MPRLEKISQDILAQPTYGYLSLFSDRRLTLKCVLITATLFGIGFTYSNLTLNIGNMGGNIFVNFFLLAVVEAPGYALGMLLMVSSAENIIIEEMTTVTITAIIFLGTNGSTME